MKLSIPSGVLLFLGKEGVMEEQAWREVLERLARIETMEANNKWAWGFMLTLAVTVIGYIITKIL